MAFAQPRSSPPTWKPETPSFLLLPPDRSERKSLADYTGSPNLDEHLNTAVLLFGDRSYDELMRQIHASEFNRRSLEMGALMADQWSPIVRNLSASFATRLLLDLLSLAPAARLLYRGSHRQEARQLRCDLRTASPGTDPRRPVELAK